MSLKKAASRSAGKVKNGSVMMAFRFRPEFAKAIRRIAVCQHISQVRVIEIAIEKYGKEIKL